MDLGGLGWGLQTIIGAALLAIVIAWAALRNRKSRHSEADSDQATRELYREEDRAHRGEDNDVP